MENKVKEQIVTENYAIYNSDCMEIIKEMPNNSIDLSIYSPPFAGLYNYSSSENDFSNCDSKEAFLAADFNGITVAEKLIEQTGVIGEKLEIRTFEKLEGALIGSYIHSGNKIATLVALSSNIAGADEVARNVSMQAAAMAPIALDESGVDAETIAKEIEIAKDLLRQEGKPEAMLDNIAKGKLARFFKDNTLVNQDYIKDNKMSVAAYVKSLDKDLIVTGFKRAALG